MMGAAALPLGLIGSSFTSGLLSPKPEELETFANTASDPRDWLNEIKSLLEGLLGTQIEAANAPVTLPTPDFSLPSFSGGSLPMPIGTTPKRLSPGSTFRNRLEIPESERTPPPTKDLNDIDGTSFFGSSRTRQTRQPLDTRTRSAANLLLQTAQGGGA